MGQEKTAYLSALWQTFRKARARRDELAACAWPGARAHCKPHARSQNAPIHIMPALADVEAQSVEAQSKTPRP